MHEGSSLETIMAQCGVQEGRHRAPSIRVHGEQTGLDALTRRTLADECWGMLVFATLPPVAFNAKNRDTE